MKNCAESKLTTIPWKWILLAGFCGGMAEVFWVALYGTLASLDTGEIAREVTASLIPQAAGLTLAPALGIGIHLALSLALGMVFALTVWIPVTRYLNPAGAIAAAVACLTAIWAFNFFIVLPALNPGFLKLMPLAVTLISKMLFGAGMAAVLQRAAIKPVRRFAPES
jgi:hypothetical protein